MFSQFSRLLCSGSALTIGAVLICTPEFHLSGAESDNQAVEKPMHWTDARELEIEGQGWTDTKAAFDRLPAKAEQSVREPVWRLSRHSAGLHLRFITNARSIYARWALTDAWLYLPNMAATGVSGLDLYVKMEDGGWRWLGVGQPSSQDNTVALAENLLPGTREYLIYLPLHNGVKSLEIGVPEGASILAAGLWDSGGRRKPILFYGTSIQQGLCASRPGMVHSAILGRRFNWPTINLGFSGEGKMESEMAELLAELDPSVYVLDCLPNMDAQLVRERVEPFVHILRRAHPNTPIVLVEDRTMQDAFLVEYRQAHHDACRRELKDAFRRLTKDGIAELYYLPGADLLGGDGEGTTDGSHPNDLGFMRQAEVFAQVLGPLLDRQ